MNLADCTTEELVEALSSRTAAGAVSILVPDDGQTFDPVFYSWGHIVSVVGLSTLLSQHVRSGATGETSGQ